MTDKDGKELKTGDTIMYWTLPNPYRFRMSSIIIGFDGDKVIVKSGKLWPLKDVRFLW